MGADPVAAYLDDVPERFRAVCADLDRRLRLLLPTARPVLAYAMPGYRVDGAVIAGWAAHTRQCGYYPHSGLTLEALGSALDGWSRTKGALHFTPERPIPDDLLALLVRARLDEAVRRGR